MAKECRVCRHPMRDVIVRVLASGEYSPRSIAPTFGVSRKDIVRHASVCVPRDYWKKKRGGETTDAKDEE